MRRPRTPFFIALVLVAACGGGGDPCDAPRTPTPLDRSSAGSIAGTVTFEGSVPAMTALRLTGDPGCAAAHAGPVLAGDALVHDGRVENAFVYLEKGLGDRVFAVPAAAVTIDQRGCVYAPHVAGVQTCQPIEFLNSDALLHNVHGSPRLSRSWNFSMGVQGSRRTVRLAEPEVMVEVRCDVHPWMRAYLGVVDHPYWAVTGSDGRFTLADVPPGDYVAAAWHERFGTRTQQVTVGAKEAKQITFTFTGAGN